MPLGFHDTLVYRRNLEIYKTYKGIPCSLIIVTIRDLTEPKSRMFAEVARPQLRTMFDRNVTHIKDFIPLTKKTGPLRPLRTERK